MKRITVIMPDEVYDKVIALTKKEKRSKSAMALILIEDGLKLIKDEQTKPDKSFIDRINERHHP
jgi:hypothetical protein